MTWRQVHSVRTPGPLQTRNHSRLGVRTLCIPNAQETGRATTLHVQDVSHLKSVVPSAVSVVSNARPLLFASLLALTSLLFPTTVRADCSTAPLASTDDLVVSFLAGQGGTQAAPSTQYASTVKEGMLVYDDTTNALRYCDGTNWVSLVGSGGGGSATAAGTGSEVQFRNSSTGAFNADASFVWDNTNKRLGVGIVTPSQKLHVVGGQVRIHPGTGNYATTFTGSVPSALSITGAIANNEYVRMTFGNGAEGNYAGIGAQVTPSGSYLHLGTSNNYANGITNSALVINPAGAVGIGTTAPVASSLLELSSTTKGFLPPRMTEAQRDAIASPATGLVVYNTDTNALNYYDGSAWTAVGSGGGASGPFSISATYSGALPANQTLTNTCDFAGTANITVPASGLYFVRGLAYGYKYSGNLVDLVVSLKDGSNTTVFSAASGLASTTGFYVYADSSAFVYLTAGTYTVRARGTDGASCGTTTFNQLFSARVDIYDVRGGGGGGGGSATPGGSNTQVQFNDGGAFAGTAQLYWDKTNNRLGVGVASPTQPVDVSGAVTSDRVIFKTAAGAAAPVSGSTYWSTDGTNVWRAAGKVGIGTASPIAPLDIHNKGNSSYMTALVDVLTRSAIKIRPHSIDSVALYVGSTNTGAITVQNSQGTGANGYPLALNPYGSNVGIGTTDPQAKLHVNGDILVGSVVNGSSSNGTRRQYMSSAGYFWNTLESGNTEYNLYLHRHSTSNGFVGFWYSTSNVGSITTNGSTVSYNTTSDYRLKENVRPMAGAIDSVMRLKPSRFSFKSDPKHLSVDGFIAHEVQQIAPYAVAGDKDAVDANGKPIYQQVDYGKLTPLLTAAIQELKAENDALKEGNRKLEEMNASIMKRLDALEAHVMH